MERGKTAALEKVAQMHQGTIIDLDASIALNAAKLGFSFKLPLADSVVLATARMHQAVLWTQDADFEGIEGVNYFPKKKLK